MSWVDDLNNNIFTIITGDGRTWSPKWRNATKEVEYNSIVYEFIDVEGSLVLRKKPKGRRFELEFYFDGENAVTNGNNFEISARDNRFWTVKHPFYGDIRCQPLSMKQDNSFYNVSKFNVIVVETITSNFPQAEIIPQDQVIDQVAIVNEAQAQALSEADELDRVELAANVVQLDAIYSKIIKTNDEYREFKSKVATVVRDVQNTSSSILTVMRGVYEMINYPATIVQTVEARFNAILEAYQNIINSFGGNKHQTEAVAGGVIASMALAVTTEPDYLTRNNVISQQESFVQYYDDYAGFLDSQQTGRADSDDSYTPNFDGQNNLNQLISLTISSLFQIAFESKQEREYTLEDDSNPVLLTHRFYGLDAEDVNLQYFIDTNNLGLNEILNIKKGKKIVYYV